MAIQKLSGNQVIVGGAVQDGLKLLVKRIPLNGTQVSLTTTLTDTGWDIPYKAVVEDAWFENVTAGTSGTISAGTAGGTANLVAATAIQTAYPQQVVLSDASVFMNATTTFRVRVPYSISAASTARSVTVTRSATTFTSTWTGNLYIKYVVPE